MALAQSYSFASVQIEGLARIDASTVLSYLGIGKGQAVSAGELNDAYRRLTAAGVFESVELVPRGNTLVVKVTEFPTVNRIAIEGNKKLKDDKLLPIITSAPARVFNPATVERDADAIAEAYAAEGRLAATVTPRIIRRTNNRVDVVFEVVEGKNTEIERITFVGNRAFSDARLRRVVSSKEAGLLRFLIKADTFDPGRVEFDKQLLKDFYASRGYVDVDVVGVTSEISAQQDSYAVSYEVREGQQFRFGQISASSEVTGVDAAEYESLARLRTGNTYNPAVIDQAVQRMERLAQQNGLSFVRIDPRITRNEREGTLDIDFVLVNGPRIVVERIDIEGNTSTLDRVVREQFTTVEGDPFNPRAIRAAAERIRALGYFSNVDVNATEGSDPDTVVVDVNVEEQGTGSFSVAGSYAMGVGFGLALSFTETNFLGRGQYLKLETTFGVDSKNYEFSFAEPNLLGRDLRFGINGYYRDSTGKDGLYATTSWGGSLSLGFPISELARVSIRGGARGMDMYDYTGTSAIFAAEDARGLEYGGTAGASLTFDTRREGIDRSYQFYAEVNADVIGIGAYNTYGKFQGLANVTTFAFNDQLELSATVEGGALQSIQGETRITDRFMMSPGQVLGFAGAGMGPRTAAGEATGGNYYAAARLEAKFPIGLPEEYRVKGGVFLHGGSVWGLDNAYGIDDSFYGRASAGVALHWDTPIGPLQFSYAYPLMSESYDETQAFGVSISAGF